MDGGTDKIKKTEFPPLSSRKGQVADHFPATTFLAFWETRLPEAVRDVSKPWTFGTGKNKRALREEREASFVCVFDIGTFVPFFFLFAKEEKNPPNEKKAFGLF